jgi:hypothetical protein
MSSYLGPKCGEAPDHGEPPLRARDGKLGPCRSVHERLPVGDEQRRPQQKHGPGAAGTIARHRRGRKVAGRGCTVRPRTLTPLANRRGRRPESVGCDSAWVKRLGRVGLVTARAPAPAHNDPKGDRRLRPAEQPNKEAYEAAPVPRAVPVSVPAWRGASSAGRVRQWLAVSGHRAGSRHGTAVSCTMRKISSSFHGHLMMTG